MVGSSSSAAATAPLEKLEEQDQKAKEEADNEQLYNELMQLNGLRRNFSDVAFWQPRLFTDKTGTVQFETTFPDNVTKWETVVLWHGAIVVCRRVLSDVPSALTDR